MECSGFPSGSYVPLYPSPGSSEREKKRAEGPVVKYIDSVTVPLPPHFASWVNLTHSPVLWRMCCPPGSLIVSLLADTAFLDCQSRRSAMRASLYGCWVRGLSSESGDLGGHESAPLSSLVLLKVRLSRCCELGWQSFFFFFFTSTRGRLLYNVALGFCHTTMRISGNCASPISPEPPSPPSIPASRSSRDTRLGFLCYR